MWRTIIVAASVLVVASSTQTNGKSAKSTARPFTTAETSNKTNKCVNDLVKKWINTTLDNVMQCTNEEQFENGNYTIHICITGTNTTNISTTTGECGCNLSGIFRYNFTNLNISASDKCQNISSQKFFNYTSRNCEKTETASTTVIPVTEPTTTTTESISPTQSTTTTKTTTTKTAETQKPVKEVMTNIEQNSAQQNQSNLTDENNLIFVVNNVTGPAVGSEEKPAYKSPKGATVVKSLTFGKDIANAKVVITEKTLEKNTDLSGLSQTMVDNDSGGVRKTKRVVFGNKVLLIAAFEGSDNKKLQVQVVKFTVDTSAGDYNEIRKNVDDEGSTNTIGRSILTSLRGVCAFYDEETEAMSEEGCQTVGDVSGKGVSCRCDHTTVFAVLMSANVVVVPSGVKIVSYITEIASIIFLIITAILLMKVRNHVRGDRVKVQICVTFSLLVLHILNVFHDLALLNDTACEMVTVLMHYFFLCSAMWMLMEGITLLFKTMDSVMRLLSGKNAKKFAISRYVISFSVPFVIVIISLAYGFANGVYMPLNELWKKDGQGPKYKHCWLSDEENILLGAAVIPIAVILLCCVLIVIRMFYIVYKMSVESENYKPTNLQRHSSESDVVDLEHVKAALKAIVVLLPVLGIPWLLGFFTGIESDETGIVFMYLNAIINGLQGVFLFVVYCIIGKEVRKSIMNVQKKYSVSLEFSSKRRMTSDASAISTAQGTMSTNVGENLYSEAPFNIPNGNAKEDI
uniref:adhesion G protein-coupled receptor E3-like isoform X1 n=1 Tax=Styela clava TaxID=7725 RepID=UPI00193AD60C|nr:adhesion G protein-coupled receptor E3-like isoform X1 [Styela clava]